MSNMYKIDEIDEHLISLLEKDACQSSKKLAEELGVSAVTVRRRMNKLIKVGVLRIVGVADHCKLGPCLITLLALDVEVNKMELATETLLSSPEVKYVFSTTGRFDVIVIARFDSPEGLTHFLRKQVASIDGLRNSETFICLTVSKQPHVLPL